MQQLIFLWHTGHWTLLLVLVYQVQLAGDLFALVAFRQVLIGLLWAMILLSD
jgi:hypothetical protein